MKLLKGEIEKNAVGHSLTISVLSMPGNFVFVVAEEDSKSGTVL